LEVALDAGDEVFGLLGASGCGKTLTMRCIAGIETPDEGRITVNDQVFYDSAANVNLKPQQRKTALLFQNYMLFPNLTVEQNVGAGIPRDISKEERDALVREELHRFDVEVFAKRYPAQLSGGMAQRVSLGRTLFYDPELILMDEPFSALDYFTRRNLQDMVLRLFHHQKKTILFVTHDVEEALLLGDRILVMENGNIKADMPVNLPTPRKAADSELQKMRQQILDLLAE
jgi:ABC-type nitrate/sulfonate/bicarbonate transport system ATPase subunit